jgi:cytochrome c biogenesis protein CcmG/thiol:disulfide interchange protein DsbE
MSGEAPAQRRPRPWLVLLPLALFAALAALFLAQLMSGRDVSAIPSALIGHPAPATALPPLEGTGLPGIDGTDFAGKVTVVNVWASWCVPCRDEHPHLMQLAGDPRFTLAGLNYKDKPENARRFLGELGNPFAAIGVDASGRAGIDWGVYGVPETFVVGRDGRIAWKHVGPFDDRSVREELMPQVEKALKGG